ncbi:uncharacterized protein LOC114265351 [Camellia sinensis]|uniref:uncharacterized protein LOC114265351 n=1 Tax=Camellia sinensis TaxID=4442 RepID=UPI001036624C|nr:uncharacterized protein LOC114265351 [Camellia sinensis]
MTVEEFFSCYKASGQQEMWVTLQAVAGLQGLLLTGDIGDSISSGRSRSSGGPAIFGEGVEAKMVLRVGEWWGKSSHNMEGPHEIGGAKVRHGSRRLSKEGEGVEGEEGSEVGRAGPAINIVCLELGTATVGRGSSEGGNEGAEEGGGGGGGGGGGEKGEVVCQGGKIQRGAIGAFPEAGDKEADPITSEAGGRQRLNWLRPSAAPNRPTEGEGQAGSRGGCKEAKEKEGGVEGKENTPVL